MKASSRKQYMNEIHHLLDTYCDGCFLNKHFRKEGGQRHAQAFCLKSCTIGEQLKEYGKRLS